MWRERSKAYEQEGTTMDIAGVQREAARDQIPELDRAMQAA